MPHNPSQREILMSEVFRIDLDKAITTEYAEYMFGLMVALNDFHSIDTLIQLAKDNSDAYMQQSLVSYLKRIQLAHLYEAYNGLILPILLKQNKPAEEHPVCAFIRKYPSILNDLQVLRVCIEGEKNKPPHKHRLAKLRNAYTFHYGIGSKKSVVPSTAPTSQEAFTELIKLWKNNFHDSLVYNNAKYKQYVSANTLINIAWRFCFKLPSTNERNNPTALEAYQLIAQLGPEQFKNFASSMVYQWIYDHSLALAVMNPTEISDED